MDQTAPVHNPYGPYVHGGHAYLGEVKHVCALREEQHGSDHAYVQGKTCRRCKGTGKARFAMCHDCLGRGRVEN
jgi:RecJ-like exonuclease